MFWRNKILEKRIKELEEKGSILEEKTKQAVELLETFESEFEDLQNMIFMGGPNTVSNHRNTHHQPVFQETAKETKPDIDGRVCLKPGRIEMTGAKDENQALNIGWWPSEGNFRWAGKDNKHPVLYFSATPQKEYELNAKIFVPAALAKKPVKIMANNTVVADITTNKEMHVEKKIKIPADIVTSDKLKIVFESGFWKPKDMDPKVKDDRTLSLAFDYIELK